MTRLVLIDNTVLSNFALVGRESLVMRLWPTAACTTLAALNEYKAGASRGLLPPNAWAGLPLVTLDKDEAAFAAGLSRRLGKGERTCLAAAVHRRGRLASDDRDARRAARAHDVPRTGTVGILALCVRQGFLPKAEANAILGKMIALGYRSPINSLDPLIDEP